MLKAAKTTARERVLRYAIDHGLNLSGSKKNKDIIVSDKQGHWSEAWTSSMCETWEEMEKFLARIEYDYDDTLTRPWEVKRKSYTGTMKPLPGLSL